MKHPGLATIKAEPAREHKRSLQYQPRWFDTGTKWSVRDTDPSDYGSRDGFGGSQPYTTDPLNPPIGPPKDEEHWTGVIPTPAAEGPGKPNKMPGFFPWTEPPAKLLETDQPHL